MSSLSLKFSNVANLFKILIWCLLTPSSFSFLRVNLSLTNFCAACLIIANIFSNFWNHQIMISIIGGSRERSYIEYTRMPSPTISMWSNWLWVCPSREIKVYLWMFRCGNIVLLTTRCFDVANFTISWCRLSFPIVGLKLFSLLNFSLKSNTIFVLYLGKQSKICSRFS